MGIFSYLIVANLLSVLNCYRILVIFPMPAPSHYILGNALAKGLAEAGHDITMISAFGEKNPPKNGTYRDIVLTGFLEKRKQREGINLFDLENMNPLLNIPFMNFIGNEVTKLTLEHPNIKKFLQANESFDAVILEQFNDDSLKAFAPHYNAPLILFSTIGANSWINPLVGNPAPPSYIPETFLSYNSRMTFWQRLVNTVFSVTAELNSHLFFFPAQNKIMKGSFPDAPDLSVLNYNASLVLVNSHESINQPVPHVPSMVDIGGFHVNPPKKLPKDLQEFMDNAKDGVVYFSMGSNLKPSQMPSKLKDIIIKCLGKLKQKVLWKWDEDILPGKPENIHLSKWFPQQDILAHPNIKLFITHGGLLSTIETVYHGVPVLAFPVFGDQKLNAARVEAGGYGINLPLSAITEAGLTEALNTLLNDPKYRQNAKTRSNLLHDRPIKPMDLAVYWVEYVIRHRGAPHLRVAGVDLPWYQYLLLDVIVFVILITVCLILIFYIIIKKLCTRKSAVGEKAKVKTN